MPITATDAQKLVVSDHFRRASPRWGSRYNQRPQKLSDLDLVLRREKVQAMLCPLISSASGALRVLDLGCGTGDVLDGAARGRLQVIGMDLVPEMVIAAARTHRQDAFAAADASAIPLMTGSVDVVTCLGMLEYVPEPERVLAGIRRVLRPGGHLILSVPNRGSWLRKLSNLEIRAERGAIRLLHRIRGQRDGEDVPRYRHAQWSVPQINAILRKAGFELEDMRFSTYGLWGRLGMSRLNLAFCRWMTWHFDRPGILSRRLAFTVVLHARRP